MKNELIERYPALTACEAEIDRTVDALIACYARGGKLLVCGNGGSGADADHIVGELAKGFLKKRPLSDAKRADMKARFGGISDEVLDKLQGGLPAISLGAFSALNSAFCNDVDPELVYAQAVMALGGAGDVFFGISTSGNAKNVAAAAAVAKALGLFVIGLSGEHGGTLRELADVCICVPERETYKVQELHLPVYHHVCAAVEEHFFEE